MSALPGLDRGRAEMSPDGRYRYLLERACRTGTLDLDRRSLLWVGCNPSTADGMIDDPSVRRMVGFTRDAGYDRLVLGNVSPYRSPDPLDLRTAEVLEADYARNLEHLADAAREAEAAVLCWGTALPFMLWTRAEDVVTTLTDLVPLLCLGRTAAGLPRHPLYVPAKTALQPW